MTLADQMRNAVRDALSIAGLTQKEAAVQLGISEKHMSQMLTGKATMSPYRAEKIAQLCGRELILTSRRAS